MNAMPTSTAPPRGPRSARRVTGTRRDRHPTRCSRSSHPHHVALARYYDPTIGRFTAVDPIVDTERPISLDRYGYGDANPGTLSDPTGLRPDDCEAAGSSCRRSSGSGTWSATPRPKGIPVVFYARDEDARRKSDWELAFLFVQSPRDRSAGRSFVELVGAVSCVWQMDGCNSQSRYLTEELLMKALSAYRGATPVDLWKALGVSWGGCYVRCFNFSLNDGHLTTTGTGGWGFMPRGPSVDYHSRPLHEQEGHVAGFGVGVDAAAGFSTTTEGDVNVSVSAGSGAYIDTDCTHFCRDWEIGWLGWLAGSEPYDVGVLDDDGRVKPG